MPLEYKLATYLAPQGPRAGLVVDQQVYDLAELSGRDKFATVQAVLADWSAHRSVLAGLRIDTATAKGQPVASTRFASPVLYPPAVFCAGANYMDHVENMHSALSLPPPVNPKDKGLSPFHFLKASRCCVGTGTPVKAMSPKVDYEAELVVVIGRGGRDIRAADALDHVAGFTVDNDLSVRDLGFRQALPRDDTFHHSWLIHKSFEDSAPIGPWMTPIDQLPHWSQLRLQTRVNGELRQNSLCGSMIYSVEEQIAELSRTITLQPGDVIFTGTPGGAGSETSRFLKAGDEVIVSIKGIGEVVTPIV